LLLISGVFPIDSVQELLVSVLRRQLHRIAAISVLRGQAYAILTYFGALSDYNCATTVRLNCVWRLVLPPQTARGISDSLKQWRQRKSLHANRYQLRRLMTDGRIVVKTVR
jgi:hypothetical protein